MSKLNIDNYLLADLPESEAPPEEDEIPDEAFEEYDPDEGDLEFEDEDEED